MKPKYLDLEQQFSAGGNLLPRGHRTASGDNVGCLCWGERNCYWHLVSMVLLNIPSCTGQLPTTKNYQKVSSAEVETLLQVKAVNGRLSAHSVPWPPTLPC